MSIRIGDKIIAATYDTQVIPDATQLKKGIVRLATDTEIEEGTSTSVAVTPKQLANSASKTLVDEVTIEKDDEDKITTVGVKTKSGVIKYDWIGTTAEYQQLELDNQINADWFYYITDDEGEVKASDYGSDVALLDIIVTNQILTGQEKLGKELQGSLVLGLVYPDAYNKLLEQYNSGTDTSETVSGVTIPHRKTTNGWKIIDISNKSLYDSVYTKTGTANYFVLDTTNKQFYLPKTDNFLQASTKDINKYNEAGLPNISGGFGASIPTNHKLTASGVFDGVELTKASGVVPRVGEEMPTASLWGYSINASKSSSIYGNSETVQPASTNVYIYYKVGNTVSVSASIIEDLQANIPHSLFESKYSPVELDGLSWVKADGTFLLSTKYPDAYNELVKELETPTRNLPIKRSTDAYGKFDIVVNETDKTFRLPLLDGSESLCCEDKETLTVTKSNQQFTAPANGWYTASSVPSSDKAQLWLDGVNYSRGVRTVGDNGLYLKSTLFVRKGEQVTIAYTNMDAPSLVFSYATGNGSLYYYLGETLKNTNVVDIVGLQNQVQDKANRNLDNTTRITNCITKVPRNIKYKFDTVSHTLTVYSGSKFIVPYGTEDLSAQYSYNDNFISEYYKVVSTQYVDNKFFIIVENRNDIVQNGLGGVSDTIYRIGGFHFEGDMFEVFGNSSTTSDTSSITTGNCWIYNPTLNKVQVIISGTLKDYTCAIPSFYFKADGSDGMGSVADEFNCCGYIGTTIFLLNGLEGLVGNGYDDEGNIQNIKYTQSKIQLLDITSASDNDNVLVFRTIDTDEIIYYKSNEVYYQTVKPDGNYWVWFNTNEHKWYVNYNGTISQHDCLNFCSYTKSSGKITKFRTRKEYKFGSYYDPQRSTLVLGA